MERKEERKLSAVLNEPLDKSLLEMATTPDGMKTENVSKPVTGQLCYRDLCRELTNMDLRLRRPCVTLKKRATPSYQLFAHVAGGNGHKLVKVERTILVSYESYILTQLMEHGPYVYDWRPFELVSLLSQAADIFEGENTMLTLRTPIAIIGDIRGQYQDLHRWLCITGFPPRQKILFLGGVIDSEEPGSLDCLAFIAAMKVRFPHDVFYIRGMGETLPIQFQPRFRRRNDSAVQSAATRLCDNLPLFARISNQILAVYSGLSHELSNYECIEAVKRPFTLADMPTLAKDLLFSEPTTRIDMYRRATENRPATFGFGAVKRVCRDMGLKLIVRARNPLDNGICWLGKKQRLISLWSAPAKASKKAAVISIHPDFVIHVYTLEKQKQKK
ncbi:hypothetical protein GCK32_006756 [Trichostrongylus colubriformis]|uniref:Serine/threonine specific protein phosphatases domain-containing protein n=1 Tax=Trichostrongylus colubriformis TaxID=6319 RepID=A0AAN8FW67_TRICO